MIANFTCRITITRLALAVLLALCLLQERAGAQDTHIDLYKNIWINSVGLTHGQTLVYTWANLNEPDPRKREFEPRRIQVKLLAADGSVIEGAEAAAVSVGRSQSFAFNRDQINLPGESGTGRLEVRLETTAHIQRRNSVTTLSFDNFFADSVEVIDNHSGRTTHVIQGGFGWDNIAVLGGVNNATPGGRANDYLIGIVPGQTLRFTLFNPNEPDSTEPIRVVAKLYDAGGRVFAQSAEEVITPGQFRSFDFNRSSLNMPGEPGTGRLQLRMIVEGTFNLTFTGQTTSVPLSASWELVDNATGRTEAGTLQPGYFLINTDRP